MEILSHMISNSWIPISSWQLHDRKEAVNWSRAENKLFEKALAHFDMDTPDRWEKVASMIPTKTVEDVFSHYQDLVDDVSQIEAGNVPFPGYDSSFTLEWEGEGLKQSYCAAGVKRSFDHERKKGVPWTEEEHRLFLLGLNKYGKGDWRNISQNCVVSRTPTQVASHAQKYFIRLNSGSKDKRRSSIHDITTVNLPEGQPSAPSQSSVLSVQSSASVSSPSSLGSNPSRQSSGPYSPSAHGNPFMQSVPFGMNPYAMKTQYLHRGALRDHMVGNRGMLF